jgi:hypothetical protein
VAIPGLISVAGEKARSPQADRALVDALSATTR